MRPINLASSSCKGDEEMQTFWLDFVLTRNRASEESLSNRGLRLKIAVPKNCLLIQRLAVDRVKSLSLEMLHAVSEWAEASEPPRGHPFKKFRCASGFPNRMLMQEGIVGAFTKTGTCLTEARFTERLNQNAGIYCPYN